MCARLLVCMSVGLRVCHPAVCCMYVHLTMHCVRRHVYGGQRLMPALRTCCRVLELSTVDGECHTITEYTSTSTSHPQHNHITSTLYIGIVCCLYWGIACYVRVAYYRCRFDLGMTYFWLRTNSGLTLGRLKLYTDCFERVYSNILTWNGINELWVGVSSTFYCRASVLVQVAAG